MATPLVKYLAQFLLIVTVPEHNTTKLCPLCHCEAEYADKKKGIRSFVCKACPVAGKDFFYDRDYGAASNIHYKAEYYIRSGGLFPVEFITIKQRRKREELWGMYLQEREKELQTMHNEPEEDVVNLQLQLSSARTIVRSDGADARSASGVKTNE